MKSQTSTAVEVRTPVFKAAIAVGVLSGLVGSIYGYATGAFIQASLSVAQTVFMCLMAVGPRIGKQRGNVMLAVGVVALILTGWMILRGSS